jgi:hypothetical protein
MVFNASTASSAKLLMQPPQSPVLVLLRATADVYIRQGSSTVSATTGDAKIPSGGYFPICVESSADNYIAVITASGGALLYATIISSIQGLCASSDNLEAAIFGGGQTSAAVGSIIGSMYQYYFASNSCSASSATLASSTTGLTALAATGDATAARFCGGQNNTLGAGTGATDTIQKYTYASGAIVTLASVLSQIRNDCTGNGNTTAGYIAKGTINGNTTASTQRKILWATDAESSAGSWSSNNGSSGGGPYTFGNPTMGFWCGGSTASTEQRKQKILYATDTFSQVDPVLVGARAAGICQQGFGNATFGWMIGGQNGAGTPIATSEKFTYATETSATTTSLATARSNGASTGNATTGIICAGKADGGYAVLTSVTWTMATDTEGAGGNAITATQHAAATSPTHGGL